MSSAYSPEEYLKKLTPVEAHFRCFWPWQELEEVVVIIRLERYHRGLPCGPQVLREHLDLYEGVSNLPSIRTIARWLSKHGLTHGRTGWCQGERPTETHTVHECQLR